MDCETVKILVLRKILNVFVPKIFNYITILKGPDIYSWQPNYYYFKEHQRAYSQSDITFNLIVERHSDGSGLKINFIKTINNGVRNNPLRRIGIIPFEGENQTETITFSFNKIENAISTIIKHLTITDLNRIDLAALCEIESHDNPDNMSIGTIKEILGISSNVDLLNLETRRVLLERIT